MKKITVFIILLFAINIFGQDNSNNKELATIDIVKNDQKDELDLAELERKINHIENRLDSRQKGIYGFIESNKVGFIFGLLSGLILSYLTAIFAIQNKIRTEISKITGIERAIIKQNLEEFNKHNKLRADSKILVLSKSKIFDSSFKKVMKLFDVDVDYPDFTSIQNDVGKIKDAEIDKIKEYDIVVIENGNKNNFYNFSKPTTNNSFIELANKICGTTGIVYYGDANNGKFPSDKVEDGKRINITFANAPSQLYTSILNMLKFRNELKIS